MIKKRKDSFSESQTYIVIMDNLPNYQELYFKIGKSINFTERIRQIQTANPFIKTILLFDFDCENYLHYSLKEYKIKNEWFRINNTDVKFLAKMLIPYITQFCKLNNK